MAPPAEPRSAGTAGRPAEQGRLPAPTVLIAAFLSGSVPFSGLAARLVAGVDLRRVGRGTVSGTGLYQVAGFGPLAVAGSLDVAKGAVGPVLAGQDRPVLGAAAGGVAVAGHNWSPLLGGNGGRGIAPALGAMLVTAPEGTAVLLGGLTAGRLVRQSAVGTLAALVALPALLARTRGRPGFWVAACTAVPMLLKRILGDQPAGPGRAVVRGRPGPGAARAAALTAAGTHRPGGRVLAARLLFDRDELRA